MKPPRQGDEGTLPTASVTNATDGVAAEAELAPDMGAPFDSAGRYRRVETLGRGGTAQVYRVYDSVLKRMLAMKVLAWERANDPKERARFLAEAEISAQLQHPGVVPVHDRGTTIDGRPFFTMQQVRGVTFAEELRRVHADPQPDEQALRSLIRLFLWVCETVAFAHDRNIVHADLKPQNLMLGEHGQVLVLDWGLASSPESMASVGEEVAGTPAYLPPEMLRPAPPSAALRQDVYALGGVLYALLAGHSPFQGSVASVLAQVRAGPPKPLAALPPSPLRPADLSAISAHAMQRDPSLRPAHAHELANSVRAWLEGRRRRARALAIVAQADAMAPRMQRAHDEALTLDSQAERMLADVQPFDPAARKAPAWALQRQAELLRQQAATHEARWLQQLRSALNEVASLPEAHQRLADHYRDKMESYEAARQFAHAARCEALLRDHDRGRHAAFLQGDGRLSLRTQPTGASVKLYRYIEEQRMLQAHFERDLGVTPLLEVPLSRGSYLLQIEHPDCEPVRYPVLIERGAHWDGVCPTEQQPHAIALPLVGSLGSDDSYIPAGWFISGGDPLAGESLPRQRKWVDGFTMKRHPVTNDEYLVFLNDLVAQGRIEEAERHAPGPPISGEISDDEPLTFRRGMGGVFSLPISPRYQMVGRWPVALVDWYGACAYASWWSMRCGDLWALPVETQWEKAARGVDGRFAPWGDHIEPTWACMLNSSPEPPHRQPVDRFCHDKSPYGVMGMAGNVRDWCANEWRAVGAEPKEAEAAVGAAVDHQAVEQAVRGGCWSDAEALCRTAVRFAARRTIRFRALGFRLVRSRCLPAPGPR